MKSNLRKVLAALLSVALLLSCVGMTAFAAETERTPYTPEHNMPKFVEETKTVTHDVIRVSDNVQYVEGQVTETYTRSVLDIPETAASTMDLTKVGENVYTFSNFADLKTLASVGYAAYTEFYYVGSEPLVISESLVLPANVSLVFNEDNASLVINEGVTFETSNYSNDISTRTLEVKGTFISRGYVYVEQALTVTGELIMHNSVYVGYGAQIIGLENIKANYDYVHLTWSVWTDSLDDLATLVNEAAASTMDYDVYVDLSGDATLAQNLTIPANMYLSIWSEGTVTIAPGVTLETYGYVNTDATMVVHGTLSVNERFYYNGESLTFSATGRLAGRSCLSVESYQGELTAYTDVVTGLDPANIYVEEQQWEEGYIQWDIYDITGKIKLSTPTELQWHKEAAWEWDPETETSTTYPVDKITSCLWKCGEVMQNELRVTWYQLLEDGSSVMVDRVYYYISSTEQHEYYSSDHFSWDDRETGTYYFTVQAIADGDNYVSSDVATSDTWYYVKPEAKLEACSNPQWNWPSGTWTTPATTEEYPSFCIEVLFATTAAEEPRRVATGRGWYDQNFKVWDEVIENQGLGYYYFRVRLMSDDITQVSHGDWSPLSAAYNLTTLSEEVADSLDNILGNTEVMTDEEIRQSVQDLDTEELKESMLADKGASGIMDTLADLEAAVGGPAGVTVSEEAAEFDASLVSVVGANLNDAAQSEDPITLVIDKPEEDHVVDTMFDNAVAVSFSMTLDNVEDAKNLEVPVMVTLPIPASINPDFLVILHYAQDGTIHERIRPNIFREGAQWYASFALTSFSDFTMTQVASRPTVDMYRMYDPNSGEHFYTGSDEERDNLVAVGWNYEGVGFTFPLTTGDPVHRLYDEVTGEHLYTMDENEKATLMAQGWNYEGIAFNSGYDVEVPQYRLHNPNETRGAYHFTASAKEKDNLIALGWEYQGIGWYSCGVIPAE